jgi:hypothetical protein
MKPIKCKPTPDQIMALEKLMEQLPLFNPMNRNNRVIKSILVEVADKIHIRYRKLLKTANLFNNDKTISLELKYHEVSAIHLFIQIMLPDIPNQEKRYNDLLQFSNFLNQKLA